MNWFECGVIFIVAVIASVTLTPFARSIATKFDAIDYPDRRRVNTKPIPRMGGIALFGGIAISLSVVIAGVNLWGWTNPFTPRHEFEIDYILLGLGFTFMFIVGAIDDVVNLRAKLKLVGQVIAACLVSSSGLLLSNIQNPFIEGGFIEFGVLSYPITVFYLVAFANVINLIDGLDGLASGISAISAGAIFTFSVFAGRYEAALLSIIIVGVCVGFLKSNQHPATIFMGDSGSLVLGLALGVVSLFAIARSTLFISLLVPIMAAGVPITDTAVAIIRRKRAHQRVDQPDTGHIHHRLMKAGFSQSATVAIMWAWTAALSVCSIILAESDGVARVIAIMLAAAITGFAIRKLRLLEPVLRHHYSPRHTKARRNDVKK